MPELLKAMPRQKNFECLYHKNQCEWEHAIQFYKQKASGNIKKGFIGILGGKTQKQYRKDLTDLNECSPQWPDTPSVA